MKLAIYSITIGIISTLVLLQTSYTFALPQAQNQAAGTAAGAAAGAVGGPAGAAVGGAAGAAAGTASDASTSNSSGGGSNPLQEGLGQFGGLNSGLRTEGGLVSYIATIIRWGLGLLGTVFFILIVINGGKYMTAGGDTKKTQDAISAIANAVIGLVIIMGAFLITNYVTSALVGSGGTSSIPYINYWIYG